MRASQRQRETRPVHMTVVYVLRAVSKEAASGDMRYKPMTISL